MLFNRNELRPLLQQVASDDPDLTTLHLSHKKITNKQLLQISDALRSNTHIAEIWLTNNLLADDADGAGGVGYLAGMLESNRSVMELYLGGNKIGAKGASSIANLLRANDVLTDVGLEDNAICDGGAKMLADALADNDALQTLKLQGNDIQTEGTLQTIRELLKRNRVRARRKFEAEHPDMVTHKIKKPPPKKKREKRRSSRGGRERKKRSEEKRRGDGEGKKSASGSKPQSAREGRDRREAEQKAAAAEATQAATLRDRFRGLGLGNKKQVASKGDGGLERHNGLARATFV